MLYFSEAICAARTSGQDELQERQEGPEAWDDCVGLQLGVKTSWRA